MNYIYIEELETVMNTIERMKPDRIEIWESMPRDELNTIRINFSIEKV